MLVGFCACKCALQLTVGFSFKKNTPRAFTLRPVYCERLVPVFSFCLPLCYPVLFRCDVTAPDLCTIKALRGLVSACMAFETCPAHLPERCLRRLLHWEAFHRKQADNTQHTLFSETHAKHRTFVNDESHRPLLSIY